MPNSSKNSHAEITRTQTPPPPQVSVPSEALSATQAISKSKALNQPRAADQLQSAPSMLAHVNKMISTLQGTAQKLRIENQSLKKSHSKQVAEMQSAMERVVGETKQKKWCVECLAELKLDLPMYPQCCSLVCVDAF